MRKLLLYSFLGLMCYHLLGFFTYFEWKRYQVRKEVKKVIKQSVSESQLTQFHFTNHEVHQLKWVKSHEFILNGHYFDVIKKAKSKDGYFFKCIRDDQETQLFSQLRSMTSFNLSHSGENHPVNVWFKFLSEPMEVIQTSLDYSILEMEQKSPILFTYEESSYSSLLFTETPPPDFLS